MDGIIRSTMINNLTLLENLKMCIAYI